MNHKQVGDVKHYDTVILDRWHCGLLSATETCEITAHVTACAQCRHVADFGARTTGGLMQMRLPVPRRRAIPSRVPRLQLAAGGLVAALALAGILVVPHWRAGEAVSVPPRVSEVSDVVQHQHFYEWLAAHPQLLEGRHRATSA